MSKKTIFFSFLIFLFSSSVSFSANVYEDGIYEASQSFVTVEVLIEDGKIADVKIVEHGGGGDAYKEMVDPVLEDIVKKQSVEVDSVTGATISSEHVKKAVSEILEKARKEQ